MENLEDSKHKRARKKVEVLKGFYIHLSIYLLVNGFFTVNKVMRNYYNGESISDAFLDIGTFATWALWGLGLAFHALKAFDYHPFLSKDWERRQIARYMEEEKNEADKFK